VNAHHQPSRRARIAAWWLSFRTDPYTAEELALLKQAPVEGKAIRRHRRKRRVELLRNGGES
jgi:hypothetical protein